MGLWLPHAWFRIPLPTLKFNDGVWLRGKACGNAWINFHNMQVRVLLLQPIFLIIRSSSMVEQPVGCGFEPHLQSQFHYRGVAQFGSATGLGPVGRKFEPCYPDCRSVVSIDKTTISKIVILGLNPGAPAKLNRKLTKNAQIRLCALSNRQLC